MSQKLKKSEQIILLKAQVIKLKRKFKEAKSELADRDNDIHDLTTKIIEQELFIAKLRGTVKSESKNPRKYPNESSVEFRGVDGKTVNEGCYFFKLENGLRYYATGNVLHSEGFSDNIKDAKLYNDVNEFKDDYGINDVSQYRYEHIKPKKAVK